MLPEVDVCLTDPGFGIDRTVRSSPKTVISVWMGDIGLAAALHTRDLELEGPEQRDR